MMKFKYIPISNNKQFGKTRDLKDVEFIVVHDTGNTKVGAGAMNHYLYLENATRSGSAHYYVDDKEIIQPIGDSTVAWAVGDAWANKHRTRTDVTNYNSLSVEICINSDSNYNQAVKNANELIKNLMIKFNIPVDRVVRHFDATGKPCPNTMKANNWEKWGQFIKELKNPIIYKMDLSEDSDFGGDSGVSNWAVNWEKATDLKVVDGTRPKEPATREEVVEMLFRLRGV